MIDSQSLSDHIESIPEKIIMFITSVFKILGHGFIVLIGFYLLLSYFLLLNLNFWLGNYIIFLPYVLLFAIPLVFILLGALNSYSVRFIYNRKTEDKWLSLLIEGFLVCFIGVLFSVVWLILFSFFVGPHWPPFLFTFGWLFIIYHLLLIPSLGYITKEVTIVFFTKNKTPEKTPVHL